MTNSEWAYGSGRRGTPKPPMGSGKKMGKCPECKQDVEIYIDSSIAQHKVFKLDKKGKKTSAWSYCPRKKK
jgi:hypothetical protein